MIPVGVLVPHFDGTPGLPTDRPIGRAALHLAEHGIDVILGHHATQGELHGFRATSRGYEPARGPVRAALDRFPSQLHPEPYAALLHGLGPTPVCNPPDLALLCRDKLATQRVLEAASLPIPEVEADPTRFPAALDAWGSAFLKPRYGAFGRGITRVLPGDPLPHTGEGTIPGLTEPLLLQRAVLPPAGFRGVACRVLLQRTVQNDWWVGPPVARRSRTDWVVNASRGAEVVPLEPDLTPAIQALAHRAALALAAQPGGTRLIEIGVDVLIGSESPQIVEINSKPRGRLEALAGHNPSEFGPAHLAAVCRPLQFLAHGAL